MTENGTILVVDDDEDVRQSLTVALGHHGYRTLEADDGRQARQLIAQHRPALVILDLMMPRSGGLAVLEQFQGKADAPRFIMITASPGQRLRDQAELLGVVDYLRKPFSIQRLLEGVTRAVRPPAAAQAAAKTAEEQALLLCRCPGCGSRIKAPAKLLGQTRNCPGCRRSFVVAVGAPDDEGPTLAADVDRSPPPPGSRR
jgi:DNA-binding NtrC family response regulator